MKANTIEKPKKTRTTNEKKIIATQNTKTQMQELEKCAKQYLKLNRAARFICSKTDPIFYLFVWMNVFNILWLNTKIMTKMKISGENFISSETKTPKQSAIIT